MINDYLEHKLTNEQIEIISNWFSDGDFDLDSIANNDEQAGLLKRIQKIVYKTGAVNLKMALYFMILDENINELFQVK